MNQLYFCNHTMPVLNSLDLYAASEGFFHADRTLPFHVLIYVLEGTIYVSEEGTDYAVSPGELLFLKSGLHHYGTLEIPKGTRWFFIHFELEPSEEFPSFTPDFSPLGAYERLNYSIFLPKTLSGLTNSEIEQSLYAFVAYMHSDSPEKRWNGNRILFELLSKIAFYGKQPPQTLSLTDRICDFLSAHYTEPFSAAFLEQNFFLSYKYLAACFKKEKGLTMQQYHNRLRMENAAKLLRSTLLPVGEISERLGFKDMLYFSRCFHQYYGTSPSAYRKNLPANY